MKIIWDKEERKMALAFPTEQNWTVALGVEATGEWEFTEAWISLDAEIYKEQSSFMNQLE